MSVVAGPEASEEEGLEISPITIIIGSIIVLFIIYMVYGMAGQYLKNLISISYSLKGLKFYNFSYYMAIIVVAGIGLFSGLFQREEYVFLTAMALISLFFITLFIILPLASVGSGYTIFLKGSVPIHSTGTLSGTTSENGHITGTIEQSGTADVDLKGSAVQSGQGMLIQPLIMLIGIIIVLSAVLLASYFTGRIFRSYLEQLV